MFQYVQSFLLTSRATGPMNYVTVAQNQALACGLAISRGGARFIDGSDGGLGEVIDHRKRFELPHTGWGTFCSDCCLWWWCSPCVGTQEYRQIMTLLGRGPLRQ